MVVIKYIFLDEIMLELVKEKGETKLFNSEGQAIYYAQKHSISGQVIMTTVVE